MKNARHLLIVDDDPDDIEIFKEALYEVDQFAICTSKKDGREALEFLNQSNVLPDMIFLDLNMPRVNGKQCLTEIKKSKRISHIPVIIYSTTKLKEDEESLKRIGAELFVIKPSSFSGIRETIEHAISRFSPLETD